MSSVKLMQHRRTHNLILISKLLGCRENVSPLTLILDSLEQSARPLVKEMIRRANVSMPCFTIACVDGESISVDKKSLGMVTLRHTTWMSTFVRRTTGADINRFCSQIL